MPQNPIAGRVDGDARYREARRVTLAGAAVNLVLAISKVAFGILGHSQALLADGLDSLSDLVSDVLVLYAARQGSRAADAGHPYGHARIETAMTEAIGMLFVAVAAGIMFDALRRLFSPGLLLQPTPIALVVAVAAILAKEGLYRYTLQVGRRQRSALLEANAWHHRTDAISSLIVLLGVTGTLLGLPYLDALAAVVVAVMVARVGLSFVSQSVRELVDTGLEPERVEAIRNSILTVHGVQALHQLRTRRMGSHALADVHILVDPRVSVSEGHLVGDKVQKRLLKDVEELTDVTVHVDPEDDEVKAPCTHLPLRDVLLEQLAGNWQDIPEAKLLEDVTLHYLNGEIHVEAWLPLACVSSIEEAQALSERFSRAAQSNRHIAKVDVLFH